MKTVNVAAAVIRKGTDIFAVQRGYGEYKDWWEFPGGKLEAGESAEHALIREIKEELDTEIRILRYLDTIETDYPSFHLSMQCFLCEVVKGDLELLEAEDSRWLDADHLEEMNWLPADRMLLPKLKRFLVKDHLYLQLDEYHEAEEIDAQTYRINENGLVNCYLLIGDEHALLIDLGTGAGNLRKCIRKLTDKSIAIAATHRHPDHVGAAGQFGYYYADAEDCTAGRNLMCLPQMSKLMIPASMSYNPDSAKKAEIWKLKEGMVFDLGGRKIRTEKIPGHTQGSVMFLDDERKMMFTGDDCNPNLWMHLPGCTSLQKWTEGAEKILKYLDAGYCSWYGHDDGIQTKEEAHRTYHLVQELIAMAQQGTLPEVSEWPAEDAAVKVRFCKNRIL